MRYRIVPYQPKKTKLDDLGPVIYSTRKMEKEFKQILKQITSILESDPQLAKKLIGITFYIKYEEFHDIIRNYIEKIIDEKGLSSEKQIKLFDLFKQMEFFVTGQNELIQQRIKNEPMTQYLDAQAVTKSLIAFNLQDFSIDNGFCNFIKEEEVLTIMGEIDNL